MCLDRWTQKAPNGAATGQLTPDQAAFKQAIVNQSQWPADAFIGTHATTHRQHRFSDGTGQCVRLDQDGDDWFDLGGGAGTIFKVGRV